MQPIKIKTPTRQTTYEGAILYEDAEAIRYLVLAQSLNQQSVFMRRQVKEGKQWHNTDIYAIAPTHRIQLDTNYLEPGPWLHLFNNIEFNAIAAA